MKKFYTYCSVALLSAATLSSCSRSNYAFQPSGPAYHATTTTAAAPVAAAPEATASASTAGEAVVATEAPAKTAAKALVAAPAAKSKVAMVKEALQTSESAPAKVEAKQLLKQVKKATAKAPAGTTAEGKSQLIALILAVVVGTLGVHRFYLGYTGRGILLAALTLVGWIIIVGPLIALVMTVIDAINIYQGELKPVNGDYTEKLDSSSSKSDTKTDSKKK